MEIMYPIVIGICIIAVIAILLFKFKRHSQYTNGKKVANTKYVKQTDYYKYKVKKYKIISKIIIILSVLSIILSSFLIARIVKIQTRSDEKYNRDILIGLDMSTSQCEVNLELIKKFKKIIPNIEGDRIGIVIFNTAPIVYCPLTDDYDYINESINTIEKQLEYMIQNGYTSLFNSDDDLNTAAFWNGGILANNEERGSSLVGDGLAATVFSFPDLKTNKDRTRIIIFATDNAVSGKEEVSLEDACKICKKYGIKLYAYCPTVEMNSYTTKDKIEAYRKAVVQIAEGKFYLGDLKNMSSNIVDEIKEMKTSLTKTSKKTIITDYPEIVFIALVIIFSASIFIEKRIRI